MRKSGEKVEKKWRKSGEKVEKKWRKSGGKVEEKWRKRNLMQKSVFNSHQWAFDRWSRRSRLGGMVSGSPTQKHP